MKKTLLLFAVLCALSGAAAAQIKASPLEGRWILDEKDEGGDAPEPPVEMIFFGNVLLFAEANSPEKYEGMTFIFTDRAIRGSDNEDDWELKYHFSGNTLTLTSEENEQFSCTKAHMAISPLEGIWIAIDDEESEPQELLLFAGDIMAYKDGRYWEGVKARFKGSTLNIDGEFIEFSVLGKILTFYSEGEKTELKRIY